jgi:hypothetical protein
MSVLQGNVNILIFHFFDYIISNEIILDNFNEETKRELFTILKKSNNNGYAESEKHCVRFEYYMGRLLY